MPRKNANPIPEPFKSAGPHKRLAALRVAERSGVGERVEVAMFDAVLNLTG